MLGNKDLSKLSVISNFFGDNINLMLAIGIVLVVVGIGLKFYYPHYVAVREERNEVRLNLYQLKTSFVVVIFGLLIILSWVGYIFFDRYFTK